MLAQAGILSTNLSLPGKHIYTSFVSYGPGISRKAYFAFWSAEQLQIVDKDEWQRILCYIYAVFLGGWWFSFWWNKREIGRRFIKGKKKLFRLNCVFIFNILIVLYCGRVPAVNARWMHCSLRLIVQTLVFSRSYLQRQVSPPDTLVVKGGTTWERNGQ